MKLHVIFDQKGNIIALGEISAGGADAPASRPRPMKGQSAAELEVPKEHSHHTLAELHERLKVDTTASHRRLIPRK